MTSLKSLLLGLLILLTTACSSPTIVRPGAYHADALVYFHEDQASVQRACEAQMGPMYPLVGCAVENKNVIHVVNPRPDEPKNLAYLLCVLGHEFMHHFEGPSRNWHAGNRGNTCGPFYRYVPSGDDAS